MKNKKLYKIALLTLIFLTATATKTMAQQTQAQIRITPENQTIPQPGLPYTINITIQNVNDLYGWELKLYYPNNILNGTEAKEGPMLKAEGALTFFLLNIFTDNYNETHGIVNMLCLRVEPEMPGVNGDGVLATITFKTTSTGNALIHLEDVKLSDSNANPIPYTIIDATLTVIPEYPIAYLTIAITLSAITTILLKTKLKTKKWQKHTTNETISFQGKRNKL
ncbi:MAG: cohesin domain-containing protein [Candidatus Bathyarchaeia archaeon]